VSLVYVLLPPSETKEIGGAGPVLDLDGLPFPTLGPTRARLVSALTSLAADLPASRAALKVSAGLDHEIAANAVLSSAPTSSALRRYTGVLYASMQTPPMSASERSRAEPRILITSALFGLLTGDSAIPAYRLSAGSRLPGLPTIASLWKPEMAAVLAGLDEPVLDLRSGAYAAFAPAPGAITVRVVTVTRAGETKPVSHDNKAIKGVLARLVATTRGRVDTIPKLLTLTYRAGLSVKRTGPLSLDLIAPPVH
jgi:cytoplasmic iron level regulating protein YaaA (DUF328/UPF0246 family)